MYASGKSVLLLSLNQASEKGDASVIVELLLFLTNFFSAFEM